MYATYPRPGSLPTPTGLGAAAAAPADTSIASTVAPMVFVGCALGAIVGWTGASLANLKYGPRDAKGQHPLGQAIGAAGGITLGALIAAGWAAKCPACPPCPPPQTIYVTTPAPQQVLT